MIQEYEDYLPAVSMAKDILWIHRRIKELEAEVEDLRQYKKRYDDTIQADLKHGHAMMGNILGLPLTPGVSEALIQNGKPENFTQEEGHDMANAQH